MSKNKTLYIDIDRNRFLSEKGGMLTEWPTISYGACPTWTLCFVRPDTYGNLQPIDISDATAWHAAVDIDFDKNSTPMIRTLDADIDKSAVTSGILQVPLNANNTSFEQKIGTRNSLGAFFEIRGYDPSGYVIYDYRFSMYALGAVDPQGAEPLPLPSGYATEDWTYAILRAAPEYRFSVDGTGDWHSTRTADDSYYQTRYPEGQWSEAILIVNGVPPSLSSYATIEYVDDVSGWLYSELSGGGGGSDPNALTGVTLNGSAGTVTDHVAALSLDLSTYATKAELPTVNDATLTITQGGVSKGTFTANASGDVTIALDAGGGGGSDPNALTGVTLNGTAGTVTDKVAALTLDTSSFATNSALQQISGDLHDEIAAIPAANDGTLTITQGGVTKGTFTANASGDVTIDLDAGGGGGGSTSFADIYTSGAVNSKVVANYHSPILQADMKAKNATVLVGLSSTYSLKPGHHYAYDYPWTWTNPSGYFIQSATFVNVYNSYNPVVNYSAQSLLTVVLVRENDWEEPIMRYYEWSYSFPSSVVTEYDAGSYLASRGLLPMKLDNNLNENAYLDFCGGGFGVRFDSVNPEADTQFVCSGATLAANDWGNTMVGAHQSVGEAVGAAFVFTEKAYRARAEYLELTDITPQFDDLSASFIKWADDNLPAIAQISGTTSVSISGKQGEIIDSNPYGREIKAVNPSRIGKWKPAPEISWDDELPSGIYCGLWGVSQGVTHWLIYGTPSGVATGTARYRIEAPLSLTLTGELHYDISGPDIDGVTFSGDYSEAGTLHYEGSFVPTQSTVTFREWVNSATSMRTVNILSGSIHVTGQGYDWEQDQEVTIDEYRTMWLCPVGGMENSYFWDEQPDDAARQALIENEEIHPRYSWGLYENSTAPSDILESYSAIGYFPPQTDDTLPVLQSASSAWTESAGGWDNVTLIVS